MNLLENVTVPFPNYDPKYKKANSFENFKFQVDETVHQNDYSNLGRTVIEVGQPKIVNFKKYKEDQSYYSTQTAPVQYPTKQPQKPRESKVRESREPKKEVENHTPTIYEFQRDESGALKVITSKDDSREKKMVSLCFKKSSFFNLRILPLG